MGTRLAKFDLELAPEKTRILEFGRFAAENRQRRGEGKPGTFSFLGFTYYCSTDRSKKIFRVKVKSDRKKMISKLKKCNEWLRENRHKLKPKELIQKLNRSLAGYYNYYAVADNMKTLGIFRHIVVKRLFYWLNRRSQKKSYTWVGFNGLLEKVPVLLPKMKHRLYLSAN